MGNDVLNDNPEGLNLLGAFAQGFTLTDHVKDALPENGGFRLLNAITRDVSGCFKVPPTPAEVQTVLERLEREGAVYRQHDASPPYTARWARKTKKETPNT